ncbi:hypothetical protein RHGRI_004850 [Rhododendron griersonianum]|uniref:Uncharacterized protein n=1 Tax=Rhododendron griersonianum TaxID=479676 RepID=A0AAV6LAI4_9ERIC|nr:hypothetical protein RHGRI_004850 [Rhododendron griersonianum]
MVELYSGTTAESTHFLQYIRPYNNAFMFTSFGVHLDRKLAIRYKRIYTFRAQDHTSKAPIVSQVAAIWYEDEDATEIIERNIIVQKHDGYGQQIRYYFGCYDSLQYPLLFPYGEPGNVLFTHGLLEHPKLSTGPSHLVWFYILKPWFDITLRFIRVLNLHFV